MSLWSEVAHHEADMKLIYIENLYIGCIGILPVNACVVVYQWIISGVWLTWVIFEFIAQNKNIFKHLMWYVEVINLTKLKCCPRLVL